MPAKTAKKKSAKSTRRRTHKKAPPEAKAKRGPVLIERSIEDILAFTGGDKKMKIMVSKKSLIDAKTRGARAAAAAELEDDDDLR